MHDVSQGSSDGITWFLDHLTQKLPRGQGWQNMRDAGLHACAGTEMASVGDVKSLRKEQPAPPRSAQSRIFDIKDPR